MTDENEDEKETKKAIGNGQFLGGAPALPALASRPVFFFVRSFRLRLLTYGRWPMTDEE